jgi:endonuclease YncB( thermonuclease family)
VAFALAGGSFLHRARAEVPLLPPPQEADIVGPARVVDGDTLEVAGVRVRLEGIDAPESDQTCGRAPAAAAQPVATGAAKPATWACGTAATEAMARMVRGQTVTCRPHGHDVYRRTLATCYAGGRNVNAALVRAGLAWAYIRYSREYVGEESAARADHIGIWQGEAMPAWEWRHREWTAAEAGAPNGCAIKGNVSRNGRIYHMPWSPWYGKIVMDESKGARWFCSEAEAQAAGWRAAHAAWH